MRRVAQAIKASVQAVLVVIILILAIPILLIVIPIGFLWMFISSTRLRRQVKREWLSVGEYVLLAYPEEDGICRQYAEREVLPRLPENTVVVQVPGNRRFRQKTLATRAYLGYANNKGGLPAVMVITKRGDPLVFDFGVAMRKYRKGNDIKAKNLEAKMLAAVAEHRRLSRQNG